MELNNLIKLINGENLTKSLSTKREINGAIACDMLSVVMANGKNGCAFITIQTSMNIVAVASLIEMGCIVIAQNTNIDEKIVEKAQEEEIPIIKSPLTTFEICGILYENGLR